MNYMSTKERDELVDLIAQAVIDRIEARDRVNSIVDKVLERISTDSAEVNAAGIGTGESKEVTDGDKKRRSASRK